MLVKDRTQLLLDSDMDESFVLAFVAVDATLNVGEESWRWMVVSVRVAE